MERAPGSKVTLPPLERMSLFAGYKGSMRTLPVKIVSEPLTDACSPLRIMVCALPGSADAVWTAPAENARDKATIIAEEKCIVLSSLLFVLETLQPPLNRSDRRDSLFILPDFAPPPKPPNFWPPPYAGYPLSTAYGPVKRFPAPGGKA